MENRKVHSGSVDGSLPENRLAEEQALSAAWLKMQGSLWDEALNELFSHGCALTQPLVFMFYSGICQTAPLLECPAEELEKRYQFIYILLNNTKCINWYQGETNDSEADCMTFKRLTDAFLLLGSLPVQLHKNRVSDGPVYYTNFTRASVLVSLADILEMTTIGSGKYGLEYMKMAVQLLHKCLEMTQEKKKFLPYYERFLNIPTEERRQICAKIKKLNADIHILDPAYKPEKILPAPKVYTPLQAKLMKNAGWLCFFLILSQIAAFIFIYYCDMQEKGSSRIDIYSIFKESCGFNALFWAILLMSISGESSRRERLRKDRPPYLLAEWTSRAEPAIRQPKNDLPPAPARTSLRTCLYCGQKTLSAPAEPHGNTSVCCFDPAPDENGSVGVITDHCYKCGSCGICCSKSEINKAEAAAGAGRKDPPRACSSEKEVLSWAWELIQRHKWDKALELLYQQSCPFEYPLEFAFCRKICHAAPLLTIPDGIGKAFSFSTLYAANCLKQRYEALDPLAESLNCLNYYLSAADSRSAFLHLRRLCEILHFFNGLPFKDLSTHVNDERISDYTHKKRLEISSGFAALLEDKAACDPEHRADYISMAAELLHSCSRVTVTVKGAERQLPIDEYVNQYSQIPRYERELLDEKIKKLTAVLDSCRPDRTPADYSRQGGAEAGTGDELIIQQTS